MPGEELEEVILVQDSSVVSTPVVNPPVEVPKEDVKTDKSESDPEDNPGIEASVEKFTGGVSVLSMAMGAGGVIGAIMIPKLIKWNMGWKDIVATALTTAIGGFVLGKISRPAAIAFVISAGGVFLLKFFKWAVGGFKNTQLLDAQEELFGEGDVEVDEDFLDDDIYDVLGEADTSTDRIIPTSGIDNFY